MSENQTARAVEAKILLENARSEALEDNAKHLLEKTLPFQTALDTVVQELDALGVSKARIAEAIGESRSTIYARCDRVPGAGLKVRVTPTNAKAPEKIVQTFGRERYTLNAEAGEVTVAYNNFGPEAISGLVTFDFITGDDEPWLLFTGSPDALSEPSLDILAVLDSRFDGFYYDDFAAWARKETECVAS